MIDWVYSLIIAVLVTIPVTMFHELGHYLVLRSYKIKAKFKVFMGKLGLGIGFDVPLKATPKNIIIVTKATLAGAPLASLYTVIACYVLGISTEWMFGILLLLNIYTIFETSDIVNQFETELKEDEKIASDG